MRDKKRIMIIFAILMPAVIMAGVFLKRHPQGQDIRSVISLRQSDRADSEADNFPDVADYPENNGAAPDDGNVELDTEDDSTAIDDLEEDDSYMDISESDCAGGCSEYGDPYDARYCREVCGKFEDMGAVTSEGCDGIGDDLERDYCFKRLAVQESDKGICAAIGDPNIRKTCAGGYAKNNN